jgi:hypothetical protein
MAPEPLSPEWWVRRLHRALVERQHDVDRFSDYYDGMPRLPMAPEKAREALGRLLILSRSNYMGLVVDAKVERMTVEGFRIGDSQEGGDEQAWRIWQANRLDKAHKLAIKEALIAGSSYLLVAPNAKDPKTPRMTVEDARQAIVEYEPGDPGTRAAGLKVWADDRVGLVMATLYLPDVVWKFQAEHRAGVPVEGIRWEPRTVRGEPRPVRNPLGRVPLMELANQDRILGMGVSELHDVAPIQDRINKTLFDRMMAQEFSAFRQRWATGFDVPVDENGTPVEPFKSAVDRLWIAEDAETKFGEFGATDIAGYLKAKESDVQDIASRTRVPTQYLLGEMLNVSGDTLKAAESGLVSDVRESMTGFEETLEEAMGASLVLAGDERGRDTRTETIWRNPEFRTEGETVDALIKMATLNVPEEVLWERWGATQTEIARWKRLADEQAARDAVSLRIPTAAEQAQQQVQPGTTGGPPA